MFGTLKPHSCSLTAPDQSVHRRFYCGTCAGLGAHQSQVHRGLLSHDAVTLSLLVDALQVQGATPSTTRCPMLPVLHRDTVSSTSVAIRFSSAIQMLLGDQFLADRALDGGRVASALRPLMEPAVKRAQKQLADLNVDVSPLVGFEDTQKNTEIQAPTPKLAAEPTAKALQFVFGAINSLPNTVSATELGALGHALGRTIYFLDALEDLREDFLKGDYNPALHDLEGTAEINPRVVSELTDLLTESLSDVEAAYSALPLQRHQEILRSIFITKLSAAGKKAVAVACDWASPTGLTVLATERDQPWVVRAASVLSAAVLLFWVSIISLPTQAFAFLGQRPVTPQAAGGCNECKECSECCSGCEEGCQECSRVCSACGDGCSECERGCQQCAQGCEECVTCFHLCG